MLGAGSTGQDELLLERLASAMGSYGGVPEGDAGFLREGFKRIFCEIYFTDDLAVRRLESVEDVVDALTNDLLCGHVELVFDGKVFRPLF